MAEKPRLKLPKEAKKGEVIEIKTLMPHIMELGQRKDKDGKTIPRKIINKFTCRVQRQAGVHRRSRAGDRRQPVYAVLRQGGGERHVQVHLDRRRRHGHHRGRKNHRQLTPRTVRGNDNNSFGEDAMIRGGISGERRRHCSDRGRRRSFWRASAPRAGQRQASAARTQGRRRGAAVEALFRLADARRIEMEHAGDMLPRRRRRKSRARSPAPITGDAANGAKLVADRTRGGSCLACHVMGPAGGADSAGQCRARSVGNRQCRARRRVAVQLYLRRARL